MDNNEFRKLLSQRASEQNSIYGADATASPAVRQHFTGMAPRTNRGAGTDFAQEKRDRDARSQPSKKFKSFVPRGVKYGSGYVDRARARESATSNDDAKEAEVVALEKQLKEGKISQATFEKRRDEITGGDIANTHLVKGLDRQLLARIRKGDVPGKTMEQSPDAELADVDNELDQIASKDVSQVGREKVEKRGVLAVAGRKRTRDEILADLKAQRAAAKEASLGVAPVLDSSKFKKLAAPGTHRIHIDEKGREVLTIVGEDGTIKKKVRKISTAPEPPTAVEEPAKSGADHSQSGGKEGHDDDDDDDDDIFADAGTEYNPLGDLPSDDDDVVGDVDSSRNGNITNTAKVDPASQSSPNTVAGATVSGTGDNPAIRNYFDDTATQSDDTSTADRYAGIHNVLKKAAMLDYARHGINVDDTTAANSTEQDARSKRHAEMLSARDRDLDDMDMGFGGSRNDDEDEATEDNSRLRLTEWKGLRDNADDNGDDDEHDSTAKGGKKKRKPKKRKGDANNVADIMRVIEGRKASGK